MRRRCPVCLKFFTPTRDDMVTCSVRCRVARHRRLQAITPPWPEGVFDLAVVDLPLAWIAYSRKGEGRSPQTHYDTMDPPALIRLLKPMLAKILAKRASVCWWVYGPRLPESLHVLTKVGLTYSSELFVWKKLTKDGRPRKGKGKTTIKVCENAWLATRGGGLPFRAHPDQLIETEEDLPLAIEAPRGVHSRKPEESYAALDRMYGEVRRIDLFGRRGRPGWTGWGNQMQQAAPLLLSGSSERVP
jgi:N6-adenosine-specific RNA methylase IME4